MSVAKITGYEKTIASIFSDDFAFEIPLYQRPYAWTTENAEELLMDVDAYLEDDSDIERIDPYFLGSIVLIKELTPEAKVVDGQQRLTTLTILLSVLRYLADQDDRALLTPLIYEKGNKFTGTSDRPRLSLRQRDQEFFHKYIQKDENGIAVLETVNAEALPTDSQRFIRSNALHLKALLEAMPPERRQRLAEFVLKRCYLVVVSAPERDTAYRVFSVLNKRGLDLSFTDILKADIVGEIENSKQDDYTRKWEDNEELLGREAFADLFAHIRMIYRRVKAQGTTLEEIRKYVSPQDFPVQFIDETLTPLSEAFYDIKFEAYENKRRAEEVNYFFRFLNLIDNFDWVPPAILYLSKFNGDPDALVNFFTDLERLAAAMMIMRIKTNDRIRRYGNLLAAIHNKDDLFSSSSPLQLSNNEREFTGLFLSADVYNQKYARYVLLRLDSLLATGEARYTYPIISIEHVLPQNPAPSSEWLTHFPDDEQRQYYTDRLGNLVLLSRRKNSQARNYDFERKKSMYFSRDAAPFALTGQVRDESQWTLEVLERRQNQLVGTLSDAWQLANTDESITQ